MTAKKFNIQQRRLIADFCGIGDAATSPTIRAPQALGAILNKTIGRITQNSKRLKSIQNSWRGIVGAKMATLSRVKNFNQATLSIEVNHRSVLQELKFNEHQILDAFARNARTKYVKKLKFIFISDSTPGNFPA
ncbi:MAG: DUF721 domain-containing protein [Puniceicoccales bacterium]|jgi:predicted nucleic acid-binding Zn ribbon protein|nr:DUF721 domain-containing protein [Puniceicoccales bacterium]